MKELEQNWKGNFADLKEDWSVIEKVLPTGWLEAAQMTGAWRRRPRGIDDPIKLLRIMLIHLADGCSLRETAVRARAGNLAAVSDVALLKRLRNCGEWFRWMAERMTHTLSSASACVLPGQTGASGRCQCDLRTGCDRFNVAFTLYDRPVDLAL